MKKRLVTTCCLVVLAQLAQADQSTKGLAIKSPKDALAAIGTDGLGAISLKSLIGDIKSDVVYREKTNYAAGYVAIESQNSYGHFGGVDFEFNPPFDFKKEDVIAQAKNIEGAKVTDNGSRVYLRWTSAEFKCAVDFDADEKYPLFQYLCHYEGK